MSGVLQYITVTDPNGAMPPRKIAYYEFGDKNAPPVICLHGLTRNARDFDLLAQRLSRQYHVICPDAAGRGKSDAVSPEQYNYTTYCKDTLALLDALKVPPATFIGTSMGGIVSMMIAAMQPERIKNVILNDIGSTVSAIGLKRILSYAGKETEFDNEEKAMQYLRNIMAPFGITQPAHWKHMLDISFVKHADGKMTLAYDPRIVIPLLEAAQPSIDNVKDIDLSAFWNAIKSPVLILRGKESDILTHDTAENMVRSRPETTQLVEWEGMGHAPSLLEDTQIETIARTLQRWQSSEKVSATSVVRT